MDIFHQASSKQRQPVELSSRVAPKIQATSVIEEIKASLPRRRKRDQTTWLNYFRTHGLKHRRIDYAAARSSQLPIGSGAVESAIRRVINLRVKSNATYWLRENAEAMIRLRAWIKAGRAESLFQQTTYAPLTLAL